MTTTIINNNKQRNRELEINQPHGKAVKIY